MIKNNTVIILVNYNGFDDTRNCIKSIKQSIGELPFIVIVDNASKDLDKLELLKTDYELLKIIYNEENIGFGKANNIGVDWALKNLETNYIFLLNNDTVVEQDSIEKLIDNFPSDAETILATPKILTYEEKPRIWYAGGYFNFFKMSVNINKVGQNNHKLKSKYVDFASGCALFFKTEYLKSYEIFDSAFFMYDEDVELCLNLKKEKKKIYFINESIIFHKCQGSQKESTRKEINQLHPKNPNLKFYLSLTIPNRFYIIDKHFTSYYKHKRKITLSVYWFSKAVQYLIYGNLEMAFLTIKIVFKSLNIKLSK
jgi:GT2 family glycosyltransferase